MLGQSVSNRFTDLGFSVITAARKNAEYCFDFVDDSAMRDCILASKPDVVINTAALVDISCCENNTGLAYQINTRIPGVLTEICRDQGIYFVQVSTDHYYACGGSSKHNEAEAVVLVNEYARTKYLGEQLALTYKNSLVLRTNIVGFRGTDKPTFVEWAIQELKNGNRMNLFTDFFTSSIHTIDFANILSDVIIRHPTGVFNLASSEVSSKKDFIIALSLALFGKEPFYNEASVMSIDGPRRAASLGLDTSKIESLITYKMPGLKDTIQSIVTEYYKREKRNEI